MEKLKSVKSKYMEIPIYYITDEENNKIIIDEDSIREFFEERLKEEIKKIT